MKKNAEENTYEKRPSPPSTEHGQPPIDVYKSPDRERLTEKSSKKPSTLESPEMRDKSNPDKILDTDMTESSEIQWHRDHEIFESDESDHHHYHKHHHRKSQLHHKHPDKSHYEWLLDHKHMSELDYHHHGHVQHLKTKSDRGSHISNLSKKSTFDHEINSLKSNHHHRKTMKGLAGEHGHHHHHHHRHHDEESEGHEHPRQHHHHHHHHHHHYHHHHSMAEEIFDYEDEEEAGEGALEECNIREQICEQANLTLELDEEESITQLHPGGAAHGSQKSSPTIATEPEVNHDNIHHTLLEKECVVPEVIVIWEYVSRYIIEKMQEGLAVRIPGLGTFAHVVMPNDITDTPVEGRFRLRKVRKFPVFKICPHLQEMYRLREENYRYESHIPVVPLNVTAVAQTVKLRPSTVEAIILETLQSFVTGIITKKDIEFPFPFIGKLYIKSCHVFMLFYQEFCGGMDFEFENMPSFISSVILGNMTPLSYHKPKLGFHSVFHYNEMRSIERTIAAKPKPYAGGRFFQATSSSTDPCDFHKNLFNQSNLIYDCACCNSKKEGQGPCGYLRNYDRIRRACCTNPGTFVFQKPDGSSFTPERLYQPSKVGNPILDRLADDRCLLHQAIGCWMHKKMVNTLGKETVASHYDRSYFNRDKAEDMKAAGLVKRKFLHQTETEEPEISSTITETVLGSTDSVTSPEQTPSAIELMATAAEDDDFEEELVEKISGEASPLKQGQERTSKDISEKAENDEEEAEEDSDEEEEGVEGENIDEEDHLYEE